MTAAQARALYFTAPRQVEFQDEPLTQPGSGEVLVRTLVSAISPGTEMLIYRGQAPTELAADETIAALSGGLAFPLKYGYSSVGEIEATGPYVDPGCKGARVFAFQPHQSHFVAPLADTLVLPRDLAADDAVLLPSLETAVSLLHDGQPLLGERVVVFGQGIIGLLTTSLLARVPLASLVTLDRYPSRRAASLDAGAHASLNPLDDSTRADLDAWLCGDGSAPGADLTFECSGDPAALDRAIEVTGFHGRVVIASWYGRKRADLDLGGRFHRSRMRLLSSQVSTIAPELSGRWTKARRLATALDLAAILMPSRYVSHRIPFSRASEAYDLVDRSPDQALQVVLTY